MADFLDILDWEAEEMTDALTRDINTLRRIAKEYPGRTIENVIAQLEARRREVSGQ